MTWQVTISFRSASHWVFKQNIFSSHLVFLYSNSNFYKLFLASEALHRVTCQLLTFYIHFLIAVYIPYNLTTERYKCCCMPVRWGISWSMSPAGRKWDHQKTVWVPWGDLPVLFDRYCFMFKFWSSWNEPWTCWIGPYDMKIPTVPVSAVTLACHILFDLLPSPHMAIG